MVGRWVQAEVAPTFPSACPQLKLSVWISLIPTYNSGIEQYFNYTKHLEITGEGKGWLTNVEK